MRQHPQPRQQQTQQQQLAARHAAASHVKLQQSQDELIQWLDSMENKNPEMDRHAYKKVR